LDVPKNASLQQPPEPGSEAGRLALRAILKERSIMSALEVFHRSLGNVFRITLPGFRPIMLSGPQANRFVLVQAREQLSWRPHGDPVTKLLRHGVLVEDGEWHDQLRQQMNPALHKQQVAGYVESMWQRTDQVMNSWQGSGPYNMLDEMRRVALLIFMDTLLGVDFTADLPRLWSPILRLITYISPGPWLIWRRFPRFGYAKAIKEVDDYLYGIIGQRRREPAGTDMLSMLLQTEWMSDGLVRDQLLTMLIAGHDTGTALMAWTLYLLGQHPWAMARAQAEVDTVLGQEPPQFATIEQLEFLDRVIKESLRLYPPIHVGTRRAVQDLAFDGYHLPAGDRILYSIYLTHRDPAHWEQPQQFDPDRFIAHRGQRTHEPYAYVPFGGGPRNCIGAVFGQVEAKVVLARILQSRTLTLLSQNVRPRMGATLEPHHGVMMRVTKRQPGQPQGAGNV
jgi:cytochrome P450